MRNLQKFELTVVQDHQSWSQSKAHAKAHMQLPISHYE